MDSPGTGVVGLLAVETRMDPASETPTRSFIMLELNRLRRAMIVLLLLRGTSGGVRGQEVTFSRDVLPILSDACFTCHGPDAGARKGKLRFDTEEGALHRKGRDPVIVPGKSAMSELIRRIVTSDEKEVMPPRNSNRKLSAKQIEVLKRWVDSGAKWGQHWAFEAPRRPSVRAVKDTKWVRNAIDAFVRARLETVGLTPQPEAPRETLIRRLSLDLTGLPPTPAEVEAFVKDTAPDAYEKVVERLLSSAHYGERMAWEWLEAARYADSNGYQGDSERTMYPWRDWAVEAFNRNLPFDQFTIQQLAGDLLPGATPEQKLATAFCRNHMINGEGGRIAEENRVDYVMDMAETAGTIWLGLTFNCCRCHDHKFDPLTQKDYYGLFAFFNQTPVNGGGGDPQAQPAIELSGADHKAKLAELSQAVQHLGQQVDEFEAKLFIRPEKAPLKDAPKAAGLKPELLAIMQVAAAKRSRKQLDDLEKHWQASEPKYAELMKKQRVAIEARDGYSRTLPRVMVMEDMPKPRDTFMLFRGSYEKPTDKVSAAVPGVLPPMSADAPRNRLGLARWLVSPNHPLTARVTVNRLWQQVFGTGLVKTPEDFGVQGEKSPHPELLDWLATEFVRTGWDVKQMQRLIVTSATYRQSSKVTPALFERDPQNRLLARGPRFRMPSWMIRDQALAASGLLVPSLGGPPVKPYQPTGVWEDATFGGKRYQQDKGDALYRRSLYTFWRRIVGPTIFFDAAPRQVCTVKPTRTNSPLHALTTLNDVTFVEASRALAERVLTDAAPTPEARIELAFRRVVARPPSAAEQKVLLRGVERVRKEFAADPAAAKKFLAIGESKRNEKLDVVEHASYAALCSAILNLDEALTKE
jgi:hypothetical protein